MMQVTSGKRARNIRLPSAAVRVSALRVSAGVPGARFGARIEARIAARLQARRGARIEARIAARFEARRRAGSVADGATRVLRRSRIARGPARVLRVRADVRRGAEPDVEIEIVGLSRSTRMAMLAHDSALSWQSHDVGTSGSMFTAAPSVARGPAADGALRSGSRRTSARTSVRVGTRAAGRADAKVQVEVASDDGYLGSR